MTEKVSKVLIVALCVIFCAGESSVHETAGLNDSNAIKLLPT